MPTNTVIGQVSFPEDEDAKFVQDAGGPWVDYVVYNRYVDDPHLYMAALTSPDGFNGDSCAFVQLAAKALVLAAEWTAARWGAKPAVPSPSYSDPDWVFLGMTPETFMVPFGPDGVTPLYRISGTYFYGKKNPNADTFPDLCFPRPAWSQDFASRTVRNVPQQRGIIDLGAGDVTGGPTRIQDAALRILTNGRG